MTSDIAVSGAACTTGATPSQVVQLSSENDSLGENGAPFGSFVSDHPGRFAEIDADHWRQAITAEVNRAMEADAGALAYCAAYEPDLHRAALAAANELDAAFMAEDQHRCRAAIAAHRRACDATIRAHQQPRTAQRLTAFECSRFCEAHRKQQGGSCPNTGRLDGCLLWQAKTKNLPLAEIHINPRQYLAGHHG